MKSDVTPANETIFLIDGMSQIFRAYYAIRGLSNSQGVPTNATYGFITMLRKLVEDHQPAYLGVVLDPEGPTLRHLQFEEYKAQRRPTPPDLIAQVPYIKRYCRAMNIPVLIEPDYEADDVIGTLTRLAEQRGLQTVIVTIDKDMCQLVTQRTRVLDTRKNDLFLDPQGVVDKMGVSPDKIVDLLGLRGDSSDNIPGAPGIGDKGALEILRQFGSIDEALNRWEEVQRKTYRESLRDNRQLILQSRDLVTIHRHLPVTLDLDQLRVGPPNRPLLAELYTELEFTSLLKSLPAAVSEVSSEIDVVEIAGAREWADRWANLPSDDPLGFVLLRGTGTPGLAVASGSGTVYLLPAGGAREEFARAWESLDRSRQAKVSHDLKAQLLEVKPFVPVGLGQADDLMLMAYLVNPLKNDYSMTAIASEWLGAHYGTEDAPAAAVAHRIREAAVIVKSRLQSLGLEELYRDIELPLVQVLTEAETAGVRVDTGLLASLSAELSQEMEVLRKEIFRRSGVEFNLDSPKQVGEVLFEKLRLPVLKRTRKTKGYSTDQAVLEELAGSYEVPRLLLDYRQLSKLTSTYVDALPKLVRPDTGRVHTSYNQTVAATGRLSSSNPNLQNIPVRSELGRKIRAAFVADPGHRLVAADYSQIELRVMAHLSEDPAMIDAFLRDQDVHDRTAAEVFGVMALASPAEYRRRAKVINFGIIYGLSAFGLANQLQITRAEAQRFIDDYFKRYVGVRRWLDSTLEEAKRTGSVRTLCGRIRQVPELQNRNKAIQKFGERVAINTPIQGTAADLIKLAMVRLHRSLVERELRSRLVLQVHDELVLECPLEEVEEVTALLKEVMEGVYPLKVPLRADVNVGENWRELK